MSVDRIAKIRSKMRPLSKEVQAARKPQKPEELIGALQDPIHRDIERSRSVKAAKSSREKQNIN